MWAGWSSCQTTSTAVLNGDGREDSNGVSHADNHEVSRVAEHAVDHNVSCEGMVHTVDPTCPKRAREIGFIEKISKGNQKIGTDLETIMLERLLMCMCKVPLVHHVRSGFSPIVLDMS